MQNSKHFRKAAPWWIAACGLVLSGLLIIHTLRNPPGETPEDSRTSLTGFYRAAATFGTLVGFLVLIPSLGLLLASMLTAAVIMLLILRREILPSAASTLAAGGLIYGIFVWWLQVPLPKGPLGF